MEIAAANGLLSRYGLAVGLSLLILLPLVAAWVWWRLRRGARPRDVVLEVLIGVGTAPWIGMLLTPAGTGRRLQLVPFEDLVEVLAGDDLLVQLGGNLLIFAVAGALLPVRFALGGWWRTIGIVTALGATASIAMEAMQYALSIGRVASIDDVLLNALGAGLAAMLSRPWWRGRAATATATATEPRSRS